MQNGYHSSSSTKLQQEPRSITGDTEIRHLPPHHMKNLGNILAENDEWKKLMLEIPGFKAGNKRFDTSDVE